MTRHDWEQRFLAIIKNLKPTTDHLSFQRAYGAVLDDALGQEAITDDDAALLLKARNYLELWVLGPNPEQKEIWAQWMELYRSGKDRLPPGVLTSVLGRLPKIKIDSQELTRIALGESERDVLRMLVSRRLVRPAQLSRIAKTAPSDFYRGVGLDVLVESGAPIPHVVWSGGWLEEGRPSHLMKPEEALARSLVMDQGPGITWALRFFARSTPLRTSVLATLLSYPGAALRVAGHLIATLLNSKKARTKASSGIAGIMDEWTTVCVEALEGSDGRSEIPAMILGLFRVAAAVPAGNTVTPIASSAARISTLAEGAVSETLEKAEAHGLPSAQRSIVVARGDELYRGVQEYIRRLPQTGGEVEPERALRVAQHRGQKEILQGVISALEESEPGSMRDAFEVLLFNAGVRTFGAIGEEVVVDVHQHELETSGMLPGAIGVVARSGRLLGDGDDGIVLLKARIRAR